MSIEVTTNIGGLNSANPSPSDRVGEAYKHIQLIKKALKGTFPNIDAAMTVSRADLNAVYTRLAELEAKIKTATSKLEVLEQTTPDKDQAKAIARIVAQAKLQSGFVLLLKNQSLIPPGYSRLDATGKKFINPPTGGQTTQEKQIFAAVVKG